MSDFVKMHKMTSRRSSSAGNNYLRVAQLIEANKLLKAEIERRIQSEKEMSWLNEDLQRQKNALEAVNREMEAFSYSVSHDLLAPLRHINGFSNIVLEEYGDRVDKNGQHCLQRIIKAADHMEQLINDLMKLAKVSHESLNYEQVDLSNMVREIISDLQRSDPTRQVDLNIADDLTAFGDGHLLRVVLENLLNNAWKYTARTEMAIIRFGICLQDGESVCFVSDNGIGFDMKYADKLFNAFQRLHGTEEFAGTGIGLATVQRIIHRHGGKIWATGEIDKGAVFYFTLPRKRAPRDDGSDS